jgi:hypothetical protein
MTTFHRGLGLAGITLTLAFAGCGQQPKVAPGAVAPPHAPKAVSLGETTVAGPFQVTLSTRENQTRIGGTTFIADVKRDGTAVSDAKITLNLTRPSAPGTGPSVPLEPKDSRYEGTADIGAGGDWNAEVVVDAPGTTGTATFVFSVNE